MEKRRCYRLPAIHLAHLLLSNHLPLSRKKSRAMLPTRVGNALRIELIDFLRPNGAVRWGDNRKTCEGGERKPARVFSVKPARKMISNIDYPIISHLSNMPTFFWAKTRQIRGADTPRGRNVPGKEAGQRQTKWHTVWCAISICHTWPRTR